MKVIDRNESALDLLSEDCGLVEVRENGTPLFRARPSCEGGRKVCHLFHPADFGDHDDDGESVIPVQAVATFDALPLAA